MTNPVIQDCRILFSEKFWEERLSARIREAVKKLKSPILSYDRAAVSRSKSVRRPSGSGRFRHRFLRTFRRMTGQFRWIVPITGLP
ncbi:MAG: hypothetical protein DMG05_19280 [Acidobacteria bacterium]|nr:MAG: hypothetical protein DMG05_19280 [Acidobacteriota bacterium]